MEKVDCSSTLDFIHTWNRICNHCSNDCEECPLSKTAENVCNCTDFILHDPEKAIALVQDWNNGHPEKTLLHKLLENNPNVKLVNGLPVFTPFDIGYISEENAKRFAHLGLNVWNLAEEDLVTSGTNSETPHVKRVTLPPELAAILGLC